MLKIENVGVVGAVNAADDPESKVKSWNDQRIRTCALEPNGALCQCCDLRDSCYRITKPVEVKYDPDEFFGRKKK